MSEIMNMERLPDLIRKAAADLASATSAAEVLEAKIKADVIYEAAKRVTRVYVAKEAYDTVIASCNKVQADALVIIAKAQCRLADEYDAAQERGEVAGKGDSTLRMGKSINITNGNIYTFVNELGLTSKQVFDARKVRNAEEASPGIIQATVDSRLAEGVGPTKADINRAVHALQPSEHISPKERAYQEFMKTHTVEAWAIPAPPLGPLTEEVREEIDDHIAVIHERLIKLHMLSRHAENMSNELKHRVADDLNGLAYNLRELSRMYLGHRDLRKITRPLCHEEIPLLAKDSNWVKKQ
jgi:hypothetical protein